MPDNNATNVCHPLKPLCLLLNVVGTHLLRKQFMSPELIPPLLPEQVTIHYTDARDNIKRVDAEPIVAYSPGTTVISPTNFGALSGENISDMRTQLTFTVSSASKALTQELAMEIAAVCIAMRKDLQQEHCYIQQTTATAGKKDPNSTFFIAEVNVDLALGYPIWKTEHLDSILREVRLSVNTQ